MGADSNHASCPSLPQFAFSRPPLLPGLSTVSALLDYALSLFLARFNRPTKVLAILYCDVEDCSSVHEPLKVNAPDLNCPDLCEL